MSAHQLEKAFLTTKSRLKRNKRYKSVARRISTKRVLKVVAFVFIVYALYYFPLFYPIIQNDILAAPPPIDANTRVDLPYAVTKPEKDGVAHVFVHLTTNTDFVVGKPLTISVSVGLPQSVGVNALAGFGIAPDEALYYPVENIPNSNTAYPALMIMRTTGTNVFLPPSITWFGNETVEYTVSGAFGLTLVFYNYTQDIHGEITPHIMQEVHTDPLFSISSQDSLVLKRSQSLTMTLTFLLLFFVVLDFIRAEQKHEYTQNRYRNGSVKK